MTEPEELLKLIDGHIDCMIDTLELTIDTDKSDRAYYQGMRAIRWLVYNFFNAPRPKGEPSPLTEEELKLMQPDMDEVVEEALKVGKSMVRVSIDEDLRVSFARIGTRDQKEEEVEDAGTKDFSL